jgi:hypothetical protein
MKKELFFITQRQAMTHIHTSPSAMSRNFTLQPNEEVYFKHLATHEKNGPSGILYVTSIRLGWVPQDKQTEAYMIPWSNVQTDQYKTGKSKQCAIRLTTIGSPDPKEFYLGETNAELQREIESLKIAVKRARQGTPSNSATAPLSRPATTIRESQSVTHRTPSQSIVERTLNSHTDARRKTNLLEADIELRQQYNELVRGGVITDDEFWSSRRYLLSEEENRDISQRKGMVSALLTERTGMTASRKIQLTPEIITEIFQTDPVVKLVYEERVPHILSEEEFWKQYFMSEFFTRDKAHMRTHEGGARTDDIFSRAEQELKHQSVRAKTKEEESGASTRKKRRLSEIIPIDVDLTSVYGDYVPSERIDHVDAQRVNRPPVLDKYIRKSSAVMDTQVRKVEDRAGVRDGRRVYGDWTWSTQRGDGDANKDLTEGYLNELLEEEPSHFMKLHLRHIQPFEHPAAPAHRPPHSRHTHQPDSKNTLNSIFPTPEFALAVLQKDLHDLNSFTDLSRQVHRASLQRYEASATLAGPKKEASRSTVTPHEMIKGPPGFQQVCFYYQI